MIEVVPIMTTRIKEEMNEGGLTYSDLARELGLSSRGHISQAINRKRKLNDDHLEKMAKLFGVRKDYLLGKDSYRTVHDYTLALSGANAALAEENARKFETIAALFELFGVKIEQIPVALLTINKKAQQIPFVPPVTPNTTKEECKSLDSYIVDKSGKWKDFFHAAYQFANMTEEERQELYIKKPLTEEQWSKMTTYEIREYSRPTINGFDIDKEYCFVLNKIPPKSHAYMNMAAILAPSGSNIPKEHVTRWPYNIKVLAKITLQDGTVYYLSASHLSDVIKTIMNNALSLMKNMLELSDIAKDISPIC